MMTPARLNEIEAWATWAGPDMIAELVAALRQANADRARLIGAHAGALADATAERTRLDRAHRITLARVERERDELAAALAEARSIQAEAESHAEAERRRKEFWKANYHTPAAELSQLRSAIESLEGPDGDHLRSVLGWDDEHDQFDCHCYKYASATCAECVPARGCEGAAE